MTLNCFVFRGIFNVKAALINAFAAPHGTGVWAPRSFVLFRVNPQIGRQRSLSCCEAKLWRSCLWMSPICQRLNGGFCEVIMK